MGRVGVYLAVVQFFFALCWTVYVIFLPQLAAQAGLPREAVVWVLMVDQLVFVLSDFAFGVASDRAARVVGRLGRAVVMVTLLSCAAFVALPMVAPARSAPLFLGLVVLWSVSSSALRAPPLTLVGRHAARPQQAWLVALSMLGLGVANAASPYLGLALRGVDPRLPFAASSLALALTTLGIVAAERALARGPSPAATATAAHAPPGGLPALAGFLLAAGLAAAAFQVHAFFNSTALYLRLAGAEMLPWLAPVFWVGFNLALLPAGAAARRFGSGRVMAAAALVAALATLLAQQAAGLAALVVAQAVAGAAWAGVLMSAFSTALALGHVGREGRFSGALSSLLALAALARLAVLAGPWPPGPARQAWLGWLPWAGWLLAAGVLWWSMARRRA